jgi:hypothetical protein
VSSQEQGAIIQQKPSAGEMEIKGALRYLKNNKAGASSIAAELLKNGGPNLVDALNEVIQQA